MGENMDLERIPRKTDKGRVEVRTRAFHVSPRERSVLIMVDGKTPARLLLAKLAFMNKANDILDELCDGGFIDATDAPEPVLPGMPAFVKPGSPLTEELRARQWYAHDFILDALGPVGDELATKLENCQTREALLPLLEDCRDYIAAGVNRLAAQEFWNGLGKLAVTTTSERRLAA
jgi:hypothetical protein